MPQLILTAQFLTDIGDLVSHWARRAEQVVTSWPDEMTGMEPDLATLRAIAKRTPRRERL